MLFSFIFQVSTDVLMLPTPVLLVFMVLLLTFSYFSRDYY